MVAYSSETPKHFMLVGGKYHFNYNIEEEKVTEEEGNQKAGSRFKYNFVVVDNIEKGTLIDAVVTDRYSYGAQIGKASLPSCLEKDEYIEFVNSAKMLVENALDSNKHLLPN